MSVTFQKERMADCLEELKALHVAHWKETELHRHIIPLNMDYPRFLEYERIGYFHLFTVRMDGKLVGNLGIYVQKSMHTQTIVCDEDTLYLLTEARKGHLAISFVNFVEEFLVKENLKKTGIMEIRMTVKTVNEVSKLAKYLGYEKTAEQFTKVFTRTDEEPTPP